APALDFVVVFERPLVITKDFLGAMKVVFGGIRNREAKHVALEHGARLEDLRDFLGRKRGDDSAAIRDDSDQSFGSEMTERLAHGDAADLEFVGDCVLAKLLAFA